jgi:hypothetical protein
MVHIELIQLALESRKLSAKKRIRGFHMVMHFSLPFPMRQIFLAWQNFWIAHSSPSNQVLLLYIWAEIHQALLSQFLILEEFTMEKCQSAKEKDSRVLMVVNLGLGFFDYFI